MPFKRDRKGNKKEKPPAHLQGKQIGLYYAQKSKQKKELQKEQTCKRSTSSISFLMPFFQLGAILLSAAKKDQIQKVLNSTSLQNLFTVDGGSYDHVADSIFKRDFLRVINETIDEKLMKNPSISVQDERLSERLYEEYMSKQDNVKYNKMNKKRKKLPSYNMKDEILKVVNESQIVVISGETGCGKTTQVAQFILDDFIEKKKGSECKILCTQPRRISAIAVAQRVAEERAENLGDSVGVSHKA
jgi:ATP-dependent RNA helicase DHX36